ncbi:MAG TPA: toll/interleukin-1 receptor domain-containing protein [Caulobacterales bacterium]|nr:toll/interleukin-1 receptor domain-containing protein [Caulobacterales bacterium]
MSSHRLLPAFKNDVFVSYARDDDQSLAGGRGWVTRVLHELSSLMPAHGGYRLDHVVFDRDDLVHSGNLNSMINGEIDNCGLMIVFMSGAYLRSSYCIGELTHFMARPDFVPERAIIIERDNCLVEFADRILKRAEGEMQGKIAKVVEFARSQRRFLFWEERLGQSHSLGLAFTNDADEVKRFMRQVDELAHGLRTTAEWFEDNGARVATNVAAEGEIAPRRASVAEPRARVYLALAPDELRVNREQIAERLRQRGDCLVQPAESTTFWPRLRSGAAFEGEIRPMIEELRNTPSLYVQLIGSGKGGAEGMPEEYITRQFNLAREAGLRMMILRNLQREPREFCAADAAILQSAGAIADTVPSFLNRLDAALDEITTPKERKDTGSGRALFLNASPEDFSLAQSVATALHDSSFAVFLPTETGADSKTVAEETEENYQYCDDAVLLRVNAVPSWVNAQLRRYTRVRARRDEPLRRLGLLQPKASAVKPSVLVQGLEFAEFEGAPEPARVAQQISAMLA